MGLSGSSQATEVPSSDTFLLTWQAGANVRIGKDMSFKIAPMLYTYTGIGSTNGGSANGLNKPYTGQGGWREMRELLSWWISIQPKWH